MNPSLIKVVQGFPKAFSTVIVCKSEAVAFGDGDLDDVVVIRALKKPLSGMRVYHRGRVTKSLASASSTYARYRSLLDKGSVGAFSLPKGIIKRIKLASKKLDATHMRIYSDNDGIHLAIFDIRRFVPEARLKRKHEVMLVAHSISVQDRYRFSITLLAQSVSLLPVADCVVSIDPHGLVKFTYEDQSAYLLRDQKLIPPITTVASDPPGLDISLWLHPKSD